MLKNALNVAFYAFNVVIMVLKLNTSVFDNNNLINYN